MSNHSTPTARYPFYHRLWKPAVITSAGGTAFAIWFDEIVMYGEEILALISLPVMSGLIYLLDILIFKSRIPRREDINAPTDKKARK